MRIIVFWIFVVLLSVLVANQSTAQQNAQFSLIKYDKYKMNPAYAGLDFSLSITGNYRSQWQGIQNNPGTQSLNAHLPFYIWSGAIGMEVSNDRIGEFQTNTFKLGYNYVLSSAYGLIGIGAKLGAIRIALDGSNLRTETGIYDGSFDHNDAFLNFVNNGGMSPIMDIGIYLKTKTYEFGLSVDNISRGKISLGNSEIVQKMNFDLYGQFRFDLNDDIYFVPSIYIQSDLTSFQSDVFFEAVYRKNVFGGVGFRGYSSNSIDAIYFSGGVRVNEKLTLVYAYDLGLSNLKNFYDSTHEVIINYNLNRAIGIGVPQKIIYNPRFL